MLKDTNYQCVRLQVELDYCWVSDSTLYQMGLKIPTLELYSNNIVPLKIIVSVPSETPEVLVTTSVLPEISRLLSCFGHPLLYEL